MIGRTNAGGGGAPNKSTIIVTAPTGSTVTCSMGATTKTAAEKSGTWTFSGLDNGTWVITATKSGQTSTKSVTISRLTVEYVTITYFSATINITYPAGSICTVKNGSTTLTAPNTSGTWACIVPNAGDWTVSCTDGTQAASKTISITADGQSVAASLNYNTIPEFTYTGDYETVDDADTPITTSDGNWKIRFLTSGTLTFTNLNGAENGIDVFLVGGGGSGAVNADGGGGGGGGYTTTEKAVAVNVQTQYDIAVGASGGQSAAFGLTAGAGKGGSGHNGGNGGSGGGSGVAKGGSDGSNGGSYDNGYAAGKGQGTTTREFGETGATLYSGGGGGGPGGATSPASGGAGGGGNGSPTVGKSGTANTGGGGGGGRSGAGSGGSGIVIIRNAREAS